MDNFFITSEYVLKIGDFGFATKDVKPEDFRGTEWYKAPEIVQKVAYDPFKSDVYSCGVILITMITYLPPVTIKASSEDKLYRHVMAGDFNKYWKTFKKILNKKERTLDQDLYELINLCINPDPSLRPTYEEI